MKISHGLEYIAFWSLTKLVQIMPARLADMIAIALGRLAYAILKSRCKTAMDNLKRAFGDQKSDTEYEAIVKNVFIGISRTTIEFARQPVFGKKNILEMVPESSGLEHIDSALKNGKGLIFVEAHVGNWELLGIWISALGYPADYLIGQQHNRYVDNLFRGFRSTMGAKLIPVGVAARHVLKSLRANRIVAVASDQHSASGGVVVDFFGRLASTPVGPAAFSIKTGSPIVLGTLIRKGLNRHRAIISPLIYPPNSGDNEKDTVWITQQYTSLLEEIIRQYPDQWMWTHRRWKID
jgi:KDO2-lipid IV(A) lauroyltransferase